MEVIKRVSPVLMRGRLLFLLLLSECWLYAQSNLSDKSGCFLWVLMAAIEGFVFFFFLAFAPTQSVPFLR